MAKGLARPNNGGKRAGAGRKPGSRTLRTREFAEKALAAGISPLEVMAATMRALWEKAVDKAGQVVDVKAAKEACEIAQIAAPYCHPRLAAVESSVNASVQTSVINAEPMTPEQWEKHYAELGDSPPSGTLQ